MRTLYLTLHRKYFDLIAKEIKVEEYRESKPYRVTRLFERSYDEIHFRNGYRIDAPFMRVECRGISLDRRNGRFVIKLGEVLEVRNYTKPEGGTTRYPNVIPKDCKYWRFQGDHSMIGCQITGVLCSDDCDIERFDPTGFLRERIDEQKKLGRLEDNEG